MPNSIAAILQTKGRKDHSVEPETSVFDLRRLELHTYAVNSGALSGNMR